MIKLLVEEENFLSILPEGLNRKQTLFELNRAYIILKKMRT